MTLYIIILTVAISLAALSNPDLMRKLIFNPYMANEKKEYWRFLTSGFIHADFIHLAINMLVLYSFGQAVEYYFGELFEEKSSFFFIALYIVSIVFSHLPTYVKHKSNYLYNSLGASGAVSAILFTAILFNPWGKIYFWGLLGIPGIILGPLYLFYEYKMSKKASDGVNHDAHFWGALAGIVFTIGLKPSIIVDFIDRLLNWQAAT